MADVLTLESEIERDMEAEAKSCGYKCMRATGRIRVVYNGIHISKERALEICEAATHTNFEDAAEVLRLTECEVVAPNAEYPWHTE